MAMEWIKQTGSGVLIVELGSIGASVAPHGYWRVWNSGHTDARGRADDQAAGIAAAESAIRAMLGELVAAAGGAVVWAGEQNALLAACEELISAYVKNKGTRHQFITMIGGNSGPDTITPLWERAMAAVESARAVTSSPEPDQWTCPKCGGPNIGRQPLCHGCKAPEPGRVPVTWAAKYRHADCQHMVARHEGYVLEVWPGPVSPFHWELSKPGSNYAPLHGRADTLANAQAGAEEDLWAWISDDARRAETVVARCPLQQSVVMHVGQAGSGTCGCNSCSGWEGYCETQVEALKAAAQGLLDNTNNNYAEWREPLRVALATLEKMPHDD